MECKSIPLRRVYADCIFKCKKYMFKKRNKKQKRPPAHFIIIFLLIIFLVSFIYLYRLYSQRIWNYEGRFNVLDIEKLMLTSYYGAFGDEVVKHFLPESYIDSEEFGKYKLKDLVKLAETEKKREETLKKTISEILGIPVDAASETLTFWDKAKIWYMRKQIKRSPTELNLAKMPLYDEETMIDGTVIKRINPQKIDFYLKDLFLEKEIREENFKIGVFNASKIRGLAGKTARIIENIGGKVVTIENYQNSKEGCRFETKEDSLNKKTLKRLRTIFLKCEVRIRDIDPRYEVVLIIN